MKQILKMNLSQLPEWLQSINTSEPLTDSDTILLWKGLLLCMRKADRPSIQDETAELLASLLHCFDTKEGSLRFYDAFLKTISEEWADIDEWEAHKFVMLLRRVTRQCFVILHRSKWDEKLIGQLHDHIEYIIANRATWSTSIGFVKHFVEIYLDELSKVTSEASETVAKSTVNFVIRDLYQLAANKRNKTITNVEVQMKKIKFSKVETNLPTHEVPISVNSSCKESFNSNSFTDHNKENMITVSDSRALQEGEAEYFISKENQQNNDDNQSISSVSSPFSASTLANAIKKLQIMLERYESEDNQPAPSTSVSLSKSDDKQPTSSLGAPLSAATHYIKKAKSMSKKQQINEANVKWYDDNQPISSKSTPLSASKFTNGRKKVQFMLHNNRTQELHEYFSQLQNSPKIKYDSSKKPVKGLLKSSIRI